jgi:hypothetical protein
MSTIFPGSASVGQVFEGYSFNGIAWDIIGIDLTANYPEILEGFISASVIPSVIARTNWVEEEISSIDMTPFVTHSSASTTYATINYVDNEINNIDALPLQDGNEGKFLTTSGSAASWADVDLTPYATLEYVDTEISNIDALPIQSGNQGKFLTTSGSAAYWETVDALPSQTGETGKFLTTDGTDASWDTVDLSSAINTASAAAVTYLVDSAPSALNTLNELSAALNDDENFSTTVTNSLANKLDISSASTTYAPLSSPSLITPNIGAATGTSLNTTGNIIGNISILTPSFSTNAYTLSGTESGALVMLNNSSTAGTLYIPTDETYNFSTGSQITLVQKGSGQITIAASNSGTTTINATPGLKFRTQWSSATLIKTAANTWLVMGDMEA